MYGSGGVARCVAVVCVRAYFAYLCVRACACVRVRVCACAYLCMIVNICVCLCASVWARLCVYM